MAGILISRRGAIAAKKILPVTFQAVSTLSSVANGFTNTVTATGGVITTTAGIGNYVTVGVFGYNSVGASDFSTRSATYDGAGLTELVFNITGNYYVGLWGGVPASFGSGKAIAATLGGPNNAGRQTWAGATAWVNVGGTAGGAAQTVLATTGQTIATSTDPNEIIVNILGAGAGTPFGAYTQTADLGPVNVPGQFSNACLGHAAGGASRTFAGNQPGSSAVIRLTAA